MAGKKDPFALWRDQQRPETTVEEPTVDEPVLLELSPGRAAIRMLAITRFVDAVHDGTEHDIVEAGQHMAELNHRLFAEEAAELGHLPQTIEGCCAVLDVANRIIETFGPELL